MKRCPSCSRVYDDVSLRFCLDDGAELVNKPLDASVPETAVLPGPAAGAKTIEASPLIAQAQSPSSPTAPVTSRNRSRLPWLIGGVFFLILVGGVIAAITLLTPKPKLVWHLVLEQPTTAADQTVINQGIQIIKSRLNAAGVSHFAVTPQGNQILVDLPALQNPERIKRLITSGGRLELVHVINPPFPSLLQTYATREEAIASLNSGGNVPTNRRVLPYSEVYDAQSYSEGYDAQSSAETRWVVIEAPAIVEASHIRDARAVKSSSENDYDVTFWMLETGAERFSSWTAANIGHYLGIVLNDEVKSIPYVKAQITDNRGEIGGRFTKQEAEDMELVLRSGALPASLTIVSERID